jgi:hypothetical protein
MAHFMLLLHSDPSGIKQLSPEEMQKALEKFMAWRNKPFTRDGHRLTDDPGRVMRAKGGQTRTADGPYSETKEILGGYYTIEAADYDDAVRLAQDHPTLEYGGTIEVRQVWGT